MGKASSSRLRTLRTLRVLRAARELSQKAVADRAGLTQTRYWQIEHGQGAPVLMVERVAIAHVLAVPPRSIAWPVVPITELQRQRAEAREERRKAAVEMLGGQP